MPLATAVDSHTASSTHGVAVACAAVLLAVAVVLPFAPWMSNDEIEAVGPSADVVMVHDAGH